MPELGLLDLWAPILAAWLATHVLSTLAWMALPHHKPEWKALPKSDVDGALATAGAQPGEQFLLVEGEVADANQPDPGACRGMLILWKHKPAMGANVGMTLGFFLLAAATIGYLASIALPRDADQLTVFRFTATAGLLTHVFAGIPTIIWFRRKFLMDLLDGLAYSLATGAAFALLWPS